MADANQIRAAIAQALEARAMSQTDLAKAAGTTQAKVSEYLGGKADVRTATAARMMKALGLEVKKRRGG